MGAIQFLVAATITAREFLGHVDTVTCASPVLIVLVVVHVRTKALLCVSQM